MISSDKPRKKSSLLSRNLETGATSAILKSPEWSIAPPRSSNEVIIDGLKLQSCSSKIWDSVRKSTPKALGSACDVQCPGMFLQILFV